MIFNRTFTFRTDRKVPEIKRRLLGKTVHVHNLDFEVVERNNVVKVIPHAEEVEDVTTLPIANVHFKARPNETVVRVHTHPRRIDVGGPYLLIALAFFAIIAGLCMIKFAPEQYSNAGKWLAAGGTLVALVFWIRMELGYFDYVRKLNRWLKTEA